MSELTSKIEIGKGAEKKLFADVLERGRCIAFVSNGASFPSGCDSFAVNPEKPFQLAKIMDEYDAVLGSGDVFSHFAAKCFAAAKKLPLYLNATTPMFLPALDDFSYKLIGGIYKQVEGVRPERLSFDTKYLQSFTKERIAFSYVVFCTSCEGLFEQYYRSVMFGLAAFPKESLAEVKKTVSTLNGAFESYAKTGNALRLVRSYKTVIEQRIKYKMKSCSLSLALTAYAISLANKEPIDFESALSELSLKIIAVEKLFFNSAIKDIQTPDMDFRIDYLMSVFKKSESAAGKLLGDGISAQSYAFLLKRYAHKRISLLGALNMACEVAEDVTKNVRKCCLAPQKRLPLPLTMDSFALCPELYGEITVLTQMKFLGVFDAYFTENL